MLKTLLLTVFTLSLALGCANKVDNSALCPSGSDKAKCAKMKADSSAKCEKMKADSSVKCEKPKCDKPNSDMKKAACKTGCTKPCCAKGEKDAS